ncbi:hypothetical protein CASFOL_022244 [Castilleja foliolosa]|uniref:Uncharacterized protein n=1 Tax=Castilleja foliolosa TaxID=1961234 RepID=A0ABD3CY19_9LAMI
MASRCRTISRPAISLFRSSIAKPSSRPAFSVQPTRLSPSFFSRAVASNRRSHVSITSPHGHLVSKAHILSRPRRKWLQVFVSGN